MGSEDYVPFFQTRKANGRFLFRLFAATVFMAICLIWGYRLTHFPAVGEAGRWVWFGSLAAELWFGFYWFLTQAPRWNLIYRYPFNHRLSKRYRNDELPKVDLFVCTANPMIEPPIMVINTVLSMMAYDYPPTKVGVYLSDDAGSILTFYALLEASQFARFWVPYCKKFTVEPRSPSAYFADSHSNARHTNQDLLHIKRLYDDMKERIETATKLGRIPEEERSKHCGFSEWESYTSKHDHATILQILIDGKDPNAVDIEGCPLPTLVYLSREKRPRHPHHFKAGAMNALIRISSKISNGDIILNVDCDMYSNNSQSVKDALCFFMDEEKSHDIAFVQFPQSFMNVTKNDIYDGLFLVPTELELHGSDGFGGPLYIGSGCFHRRDALSGRKFTEDCKFEWKRDADADDDELKNINELEEAARPLASCTYEKNTQWGYEMGLKYGFPAEDVITGLSIQCNGWKSVYYNPERKAFLGLGPTTLLDSLLQHKRWSEGHFQIFLSRYSAAWFAYGKIRLGLQLCYCCYALWAPNCLATIFYVVFPSLCLLKGIPLFPQLSNPWFVPFVYAISAKNIYSLAEFMWCGGTLLGWWNCQRIWLYRRSSSYLFAVSETMLKQLGFSESTFLVTAKVSEEDVSQRYKKEMMEFGGSSPMFTMLATVAILNLVCFAGVGRKVIMDETNVGFYMETMPCQIILCGILVSINWPMYKGLFLRKDKGRLPASLAAKSFMFAFIIIAVFHLIIGTK